MMFGLFDYLKLAAGAALGALIASGPAYLYGRHEGRQQAAVAALEASVKAQKDRSHENATVEALDPLGLCIELGGMRDDCTAELRRLAEDRGQAGNGHLPGGE
jgi:hypothetical protein